MGLVRSALRGVFDRRHHTLSLSAVSTGAHRSILVAWGVTHGVREIDMLRVASG